MNLCSIEALCVDTITIVGLFVDTTGEREEEEEEEEE